MTALKASPAFERYYRSSGTRLQQLCCILGEALKIIIWYLQLLPYTFNNLRLRYYAARNAHFDIRYGCNARNTFDMFIATCQRCQCTIADAPVFVFVHGGAWASGDKSMFTTFGHRLSTAGACAVCRERVPNSRPAITVMIPNYTLNPRGDIHHMVSDLNHFLNYISEQPSSLSYNRHAVFLAGHSAGAHLAALTLLRRHDDDDDDDESTPAPHQCKCQRRLRCEYWEPRNVLGFIGISGVYHIGDHYAHEASRGLAVFSPMHRTMHSFENFDLHSPAVMVKRHHNATKSLLSHVCFYLMHGSEDGTVPTCSSEHFLWQLQKLHHNHRIRCARLEILPHAQHTGLVLPTTATEQREYDFLLNRIGQVIDDVLLMDVLHDALNRSLL